MNSGFSISELPETFELHLFLALYETRTVKAAGERMYRSPSSVSMRLKQLESKLGRPLFHRTGRILEPTADAEALVRYSHDILALLREAQQLFHDRADTSLLIGAMDSTAAARLPLVLEEFRRQDPSVRFTLKTGTSLDMARWVRQSELDVAFVADAHRPSYTDALAYRPVFREELVIVSPPNYRPIHSAIDVGDEPVLAFGEGCIYRERLLEWYEASNIEPNVAMDVGSYGAILSSVAAGVGIAMVPRSIIALYGQQESLKVHSLDPRDGLSITSMVWPRKRRHTDAISLLLDTALNIASRTNNVADAPE